MKTLTRLRSACSTPSARKARQQKSPLARAFLFQLGLFVEDVLARLGIVFLDLQLVGRGALVLRGGIEVAGSGRGLELDFFAHGQAFFLALISRSEERRVGKECRSRWSWYR